MAGADNTQFNFLEQIESSDLNQLQAFKDRVWLDAFRAYLSNSLLPSNGSNPGTAINNVVLGGLTATAAVNDVNISVGVLMQDSASIAPVPGVGDSTYRIAFQRVVATETPPSPGSDTYYLLQAQMQNVITEETRNVKSAPTPAAPINSELITKTNTRTIAYSFKAGTATQAPTADTGFVPLAIVFRPGGGGPVTADQISDVRPLAGAIASKVTSTARRVVVNRRRLTVADATNFPTNRFTQVDFDCTLNGEHLFAVANQAVNLLDAAFVDPSATTGMRYIYLAKVSGFAPSGLYPNIHHRGVIVVSSVTPDPRTHANSAAIDLPSPFLGLQAAVGQAACVAALQFDGADSAEQSISSSGYHQLFFSGLPPVTNLFNQGGAIEDADFDLDAMGAALGPGGTLVGVPVNATVSDWIMRAANTFASDGVINVTYGAGTGGIEYWQELVDWNAQATYQFKIPADVNRIWNIEFTNFIQGGSSVFVDIGPIGWQY